MTGTPAALRRVAFAALLTLPALIAFALLMSAK
jgi:hypothetical protein